MATPRLWRVGLFAAVCGVAVVMSVVSLRAGRHHRARLAGAAPIAPVRPLPAQGISGDAYLLIRSTNLDRDFGLVGLLDRNAPQGPRMLASLHCDRVDFEGGRGLCLSRQSSGPVAGNLLGRTVGIVFDAQFHPLHTVTLVGYPSRTRVSPDGHYGATTTFVNGDSYATIGFSTRTDIIDLTSGRILFDLEKLPVTRNGKPFQGVNFNFWGVTFDADGHTFYATLGSGSDTYFIKGDVNSRQAVVLRSGVECPALSPDGRRIAFKKRNPGAVVTWRISVLDVATLQDYPLADTRDVDDQLAWLDNDTVTYGLVSSSTDLAAVNAAAPGLPAMTTGGSIATDTWAVPADGSGSPRRLISGAWSAVVAHGQ